MTDGLDVAIGVSCELVHRCIHGPHFLEWVDGLVGKISADPNTLRNVTSKSVDSSCIMAWVSISWVLEPDTYRLGH